MKKIILLIAGVFILSGCGSDYTSMVKDGVFNDHKQTTVGRAFDAWGQCDKGVTWEEFETDSGVNIVEYNCTILETKKAFGKNTMDMMDKLNEDDLNETLGIQCLYQENCNLTLTRYRRTLATPFNIVFQFTINLDNSFDTSHVGAIMGSQEVDLSALGTPADFVNLVMVNRFLSDTAIDQISTAIAKFVPDDDLVSDSKAKAFFK